MSPKPFPLPLTVGNDVANISRFVGYVRDNAYFTRWARKVFTRSEWGLLARRSAYYSKKHIPQTFEELIVPDVEIHRASLSSNNQRRSSAKFLLAKYLTGRWCMKEAAIKAYEGRITMRDISIGPLYWRQSFFPSNIRDGNQTDAKNHAPVAVIEPPRRWVLIPEYMASYRGLFRFQDELPEPDTDKYPPDPTVFAVFGKNVNGRFFQTNSHHDQKFLPRRLIRNDDELEIAHVSLSHDAGLATAVCIASPKDLSRSRHAKFTDGIIDDGHGEPIHEPQWGDLGWKSALMLEQYTWDDGPFGSSTISSKDTEVAQSVDQSQ